MKKIFTLFAAVLMAGSMFALEATQLIPGVPTTTYEDEYYYFVTTGAGQITFTVDATGDVEYDLYNAAGQYQGVDIILSMLNNHTYVWNCPAAGTYYWQQFSSGSTNLTITGSIFDSPTGPIELEFTSAETEAYGSTLDVLLSGPNVELIYETHIVNKSIAGIHNDAKEEHIALTYDVQEYLEDPILEGSAEFTFVSVDESGVYTYIVSFNLVGVSGNNYHAEAEIQVQADLSNDITPTALENTAAGVKATKFVENSHVVILRDGKKFNAVGAQL